MKMLNRVYKQQQFLTTILLLTFSLSFAQKIMIHNLVNNESLNNGVINKISTLDYEPLLELSVFGWIRVAPPILFGRIFYLQTLPEKDKIDDQEIDTIFSLSFSKWSSPLLIFSSEIKGKEEQSTFILLPEEENSWVFVYFGHLFELSLQTYFKYSYFSHFDQQTITKNVNKLERFQNFKLTAGIGLFEGIQFFKGDIERLSIHMGNQAYKESNFYPLFVLHPESVETCALGFTECAYTGKYIDLCSSQQKIQVKSILLHDSQATNICVGSAQIRVFSNIECIEEPSLQGLRKYKDIKVISLDASVCNQ